MDFQVEIDLLTGATTILQADLTYDCGKSLNPAIDLGQVCWPFKKYVAPIITSLEYK